MTEKSDETVNLKFFDFQVESTGFLGLREHLSLRSNRNTLADTHLTSTGELGNQVNFVGKASKKNNFIYSSYHLWNPVFINGVIFNFSRIGTVLSE